MQKNLTKHGNSFALIIDKPILELLHIKPTTLLDITTNGKELIICPIREEKEERKGKFERALDAVNQQYSKTLKKLSE